MTGFAVTQRSLPPIPGIHEGTGEQRDNIWVVVPESVPGTRRLQFVGAPVDVTTMLFEIPDAVVPNWFGVAVPNGISDFGSVNLFFHPTPAQAGYVDADYATKSGMWPQLFYYMDRLGFQVDAAARNQVLVMPFLTEAAKDAGILPGNWEQILGDILAGVCAAVTGTGDAVSVTSMAVSSFSAGIIYSDSFRKRATGLSSVLQEVWDLDGHISSYHTLSDALRTTAGCRVIQYDQVPSGPATGFHVPQPRWADLVQPPGSAGEVHSRIRDFMFTHATAISEVGRPISTGQPAPVPTAPPAPIPVGQPAPVPTAPPAPIPTAPPPVVVPCVQPPATSGHACRDAALTAMTAEVAAVSQVALTAQATIASMAGLRARWTSHPVGFQKSGRGK